MKFAAIVLIWLGLSPAQAAPDDKVKTFLELWVQCLETANRQLRDDAGLGGFDAAQFAIHAYCGEEERAIEAVLGRLGRADEMPEARALVKKHLMEME